MAGKHIGGYQSENGGPGVPAGIIGFSWNPRNTLAYAEGRLGIPATGNPHFTGSEAWRAWAAGEGFRSQAIHQYETAIGGAGRTAEAQAVIDKLQAANGGTPIAQETQIANFIDSLVNLEVSPGVSVWDRTYDVQFWKVTESAVATTSWKTTATQTLATGAAHIPGVGIRNDASSWIETGINALTANNAVGSASDAFYCHSWTNPVQWPPAGDAHSYGAVVGASNVYVTQRNVGIRYLTHSASGDNKEWNPGPNPNDIASTTYRFDSGFHRMRIGPNEDLSPPATVTGVPNGQIYVGSRQFLDSGQAPFAADYTFHAVGGDIGSNIAEFNTAVKLLIDAV